MLAQPTVWGWPLAVTTWLRSRVVTGQSIKS